MKVRQFCIDLLSAEGSSNWWRFDNSALTFHLLKVHQTDEGSTILHWLFICWRFIKMMKVQQFCIGLLFAEGSSNWWRFDNSALAYRFLKFHQTVEVQKFCNDLLSAEVSSNWWWFDNSALTNYLLKVHLNDERSTILLWLINCQRFIKIVKVRTRLVGVVPWRLLRQGTIQKSGKKRGPRRNGWPLAKSTARRINRSLK